MMNGTPVRITVISQTIESDDEPIIIETIGECFLRDTTIYLKYEHTDTDGNLIKNLMSIKRSRLKNHESGAVDAIMEFALDAVTPFIYKSAYGSMPMSIRTHSYASEITASSVSAKVRYDLLSGLNNGEVIARRLLTVTAVSEP